MENPNTENKRKKVSYSQFSNWYSCAYRWRLDFIDRLRVFENSINTCFGTAMHDVLQNYIKTLYTVGQEEADSIDLKKDFREGFKKELAEKKVKHTED
jgi:hypothetical protein